MTTYLNLNKSKTKLLVLVPPSVMSSISIHGTFIDSESIRFVDCVKNLGVWLDENLDFKTHVNKVISSCCYMRFQKLRVFFLKKVCVPLCHLLCFPNLIIVMHCTTKSTQRKLMLQTAENSVIRLIFGRFKYDRAPISHFLMRCIGSKFVNTLFLRSAYSFINVSGY